ncbi:universal stress protein [Mycobacterium cookii]|uniref:Universal stress protein n=1 Tax=Mycobacterium cookii TaxID=1775 RepID=A0A7I7KUU1_9MYCO|nr:universal stress protein [Mycobacterium cookii]MCV7329946.1 universal stress protein [Mycobacterium cookii]BBX45875.1 universal stress protein [Mycobacterium cookii]
MPKHSGKHQGIVVGVDGSPSSSTAVRWAAREAAMRHVSLSLVHVIERPPWGLLALGGGAVQPPSETLEWERTEGAEIISAAVKLATDSTQDREIPDLQAEVYFSATGPTLYEFSTQAQMVVVGSRGHTKVGRVLLGSVSTGLIHHARCPVAVVHGGAQSASPHSALPVVVGIDGSPASESATAIAFEEASCRGIELIAIHAWSDLHMSDAAGDDWLKLQAVGEEALAERLAGWQEHFPDVVVQRRIVLDAPALHLLEAAEAAQLVVVGSHGRGGFAGMLLGSVSTAVAQAAQIPVIVARQ